MEKSCFYIPLQSEIILHENSRDIKITYFFYYLIFMPVIYLKRHFFVIGMGTNVTQSKEPGNVVFKGDSRGRYLLRGKNINIGAGTIFQLGAQVEMDYTSF